MPSRAVKPVAGPLLAAGVAGVAALALMVFGPPGGDTAAHLYLAELFSRHGWQLWDNLWYAGRYSLVNYSVLYYPLAALLGHAAVVAAACAAAAWAYAALMWRRHPTHAVAPSVAFALLIPLGVVAGTYPFLLGLAFAMCALLALQAGRPVLSACMVLLTTLGHPLGLAFLVLVLAAVAVVERDRLREWRWRAYAGAVVLVLLGQLVVTRAFATEGARYPFDPKDAAAILAFCAAGILLTRGLAGLAVERGVFVAYAAMTVAALVIPTPIGGNTVRLMLLLGVPLLLIPLAVREYRPRAVAVAVLAGTLFWQVLPAYTGLRAAARAHAEDASFWEPVAEFLARNPAPQNRVHVVATADNWEAYHLARRGVPLTRGWFRQDDIPPNETLYERPLTAEAYRDWMRLAGVRYVFLHDDPLDYTSTAEADLLRGGASGLRVVERTEHWTVLEDPDPTPVVTPVGGARLAHLDTDRMEVDVERPGAYRVSLRYSPHMAVVAGPAGTCLEPAEPWGTTLRAPRPGRVVLHLNITPRTLTRAVLGRTTSCREAAGATP